MAIAVITGGDHDHHAGLDGHLNHRRNQVARDSGRVAASRAGIQRAGEGSAPEGKRCDIHMILEGIFQGLDNRIVRCAVVKLWRSEDLVIA